MQIPIYTFDPRKKEEVLAGWYQHGIFTKHVKKSVHYMIKESGYGIQEDIVKKLFEIGCKRVEILELDTGIKHEFEFDWFSSYITPKDYGNGLQRFYKVKKEKLINSNHLELW